MDLSLFSIQLKTNAESIQQIISSVGDEQSRWKPRPEDWSILEVINHLLDEEREDFRVRLEIILYNPDQTWPGIDPEGWVSTRRYNERDLKDSINKFMTERMRSLMWLRELKSPDWGATYQTAWGEITAGDMFAAWVAHDLLHLRQLVELQWAYTVHRLQPYKVDYAGEW